MLSQLPGCHGYRFPPEIIRQAVWIYPSLLSQLPRAAGADRGHQALVSQRLDRARQQAAQPVEQARDSNLRQETVKNSPIKRASRRRCERKQTPQNRVIATKGMSWEKTVEDACLLGEQTTIHLTILKPS